MFFATSSVVRVAALQLASVLFAIPALAQSTTHPAGFRHFVLMEKEPGDVYHPQGTTVLQIGISEVSAADAKEKACAGITRSRNDLQALCAPRHYGVPDENSCKLVKHLEETFKECTESKSTVSCRPGQFFAIAGTDAVHLDIRKVAGVACGQRTLAAAEKAAIASCNKTSAAKGITLACVIRDSGRG